MSNDLVQIEIPISEWSLGPNIYQYIHCTVPPGSNVLEFGSGDSSRILTEMGHKVWSVEENIEFIGTHPGVTYIHAPIDPLTNWYDMEILSKALPSCPPFHTVIVDGPTTDRSGLVDAMKAHLFDPPGQMIFDDIHREPERVIFFELLKAFPAFLAGSMSIFCAGQALAGPESSPPRGYWSLFGVISAELPAWRMLPWETLQEAAASKLLYYGVPTSYVGPKGEEA